MKPEIIELSLVFIGDFNPSIFHPSWLVQNDLIKETEGDNADINIVHKNASKFSIDSAEFDISRSRFQIKTARESYFESVRDLGFSIFKILNETPLRGLGINYNYHYKLNSKDYLEIGKRLVPFDNWENVLSEPRVLHLDMWQETRDDEYKGSHRVIINPSDKLEKYGVKININDHFDKEDSENNEIKLIDILSDYWIKARTRSDEMIDNLWKNLDL